MSKGLGSSAPLAALLLGLFNPERRSRRLGRIWSSDASVAALFFAAGLDLAAVLLGAAAVAFAFGIFATFFFLALGVALATTSALVFAMACWKPGES